MSNCLLCGGEVNKEGHCVDCNAGKCPCCKKVACRALNINEAKCYYCSGVVR